MKRLYTPLLSFALTIFLLIDSAAAQTTSSTPVYTPLNCLNRKTTVATILENTIYTPTKHESDTPWGLIAAGVVLELALTTHCHSTYTYNSHNHLDHAIGDPQVYPTRPQEYWKLSYSLVPGEPTEVNWNYDPDYEPGDRFLVVYDSINPGTYLSVLKNRRVFTKEDTVKQSTGAITSCQRLKAQGGTYCPLAFTYSVCTNGKDTTCITCTDQAFLIDKNDSTLSVGKTFKVEYLAKKPWKAVLYPDQPVTAKSTP